MKHLLLSALLITGCSQAGEESVTIPLHLIIYIIIMVVLVVKLLTIKLYDMDLRPALYIIVIALLSLLYGGIFWW